VKRTAVWEVAQRQESAAGDIRRHIVTVCSQSQADAATRLSASPHAWSLDPHDRATADGHLVDLRERLGREKSVELGRAGAAS
jgi:hypothetical protein